MTDKFRAATEFKFTVRHVPGQTIPRRGDTVKGYHSGDLIFTGVAIIVDQVTERSGRVLYKCLAEDLFRNFRRVKIAQSWQNVTLKTIITDVVSEVVDVILHPDQVDGPVLGRVNANYIQADELVRGLTDLSRYVPSVDEQGRFRMAALDEVDAVAELSDANTIHVGDVFYDVDDTEYVNRVFGVGSYRPSDHMTYNFVGDGSARTFELPADLYETPEVIVNGNTESVSDSDPEAAWMFTRFSNILTHSYSGNVLSSTDSVQVKFRSLVPVLAAAEDTSEIANRGVYEKVLHLGDVTQVEAQEAADVELRKFGDQTEHVAFRTYTRGFTTGQVLTVDLTEPAISRTFLIDFVEYQDQDGIHLLGAVKASSAEGDEEWREYFREPSSVRGLSGIEPIFTPIPVFRESFNFSDSLTEEEDTTLRFGNLTSEEMRVFDYDGTGDLDDSIEIDFTPVGGTSPYTFGSFLHPGNGFTTTGFGAVQDSISGNNVTCQMFWDASDFTGTNDLDIRHASFRAFWAQQTVTDSANPPNSVTSQIPCFIEGARKDSGDNTVSASRSLAVSAPSGETSAAWISRFVDRGDSYTWWFARGGGASINGADFNQSLGVNAINSVGGYLYGTDINVFGNHGYFTIQHSFELNRLKVTLTISNTCPEGALLIPHFSVYNSNSRYYTAPSRGLIVRTAA